MKRPFVPGPADVIAAVEGLRDGVTRALALVPRIAAAVDRLEEVLDGASGLLQRADGLVGRMESTSDAADEAVRAVGETRRRADEAVLSVAATQQAADAAVLAVLDSRARADEAITAVALTTARADDTLAVADGLVGRLSPLMAGYEQPLQDLAPSVRRLSETFQPDEVEALVTLIDRLPRLVKHLDEDILPVLESLQTVGTDVHDLVDTVQDLRQIVKGFPGSRLFRRRGAEEIAQDEQEERDETTGDGG